MAHPPGKTVYLAQIAMVFCFNLFILGFFGWFFYLIYMARQLHESTGPGTGIAIVAIPIAAILFWVVNYTACGLLSDETSLLFRKQEGREDGNGDPPDPE